MKNRSLKLITIFLSGLLVACHKPHAVSSLGYIEAKYTFIATGTSGVLKSLKIDKGEKVRKGQLLFSLGAIADIARPLPQKNVSAPVAGWIFDIYYTPGEWVPATLPVLSIVDPAQIKIIFYADISRVAQIKLNQPIQVSFTNKAGAFPCKITFISPQAEYTPPVIYSNEEKHKLVYRIEAQPVDKNNYSILHPGQPVSINFPIS